MTTEVQSPPIEVAGPLSSRPGLLRRLLAPKYLCVLALFIFSAPGLFWMYPSMSDRFESYQPLQALRFFASHGRLFAKYGPFPNFVLAPVYGPTLLFWHLLGEFKPPFSKFPYGFAHPVQQMGFLIVEGRFIFMIICLVSAAVLVSRLSRLSSSWLVLTVVSVAILGSAYPYTAILTSTRPDALMMAFGGFFIVLYIDAILEGVTLRRAVLLALCAVCAVSSKELIYAMFLLPMLWLLVRAAVGKDPLLKPGLPLIRLTAITAFVAVTSYALVNIVYAPATWLARMRFWTSGEGMDPRIWGNQKLADLIRDGAQCVLDNLGIGGCVLLVLAIVMILVKRPRFSFSFALPSLSFLIFAIFRIHFSEIRYYMPLCIALLPLMVLGIEALRAQLAKGWQRSALYAVLLVCLGLNLVWGMFSWYLVNGSTPVLVRQYLRNSPADQTYYYFSLFPESPVTDSQGHRFETRSFQQILDSGTNWPDQILISSGEQGFLLDALKTASQFPGRKGMLAEEGFHPGADWKGFESSGYCLAHTIVPPIPAWYPFSWMYGARDMRRIGTLLVYSKHCQ